MSVELKAPEVSLITVTRNSADELSTGIRSTLNKLPETFHIKDIEYSVCVNGTTPIYSALIIGTVVNGEYIDITNQEDEPDKPVTPEDKTKLEQLTEKQAATEIKITSIEEQTVQMQSDITDIKSSIEELRQLVETLTNNQ